MAKLWYDIPGYFNYVETYDRIANILPEGSKFIELGCLLGKSTSYLASRLKELNKKFEFHVVDTFEGTAGEHDHLTDFYDLFIENCGHFINEGWITKVHKTTTDEAVMLFQDKYFDAILVDADHKYEAVMKDVKNWLPKLKDDGTMFGDDYYMESVKMGCHKGLMEHYQNNNVPLYAMFGQESTWVHDKTGKQDRWLKKIP